MSAGKPAELAKGKPTGIHNGWRVPRVGGGQVAGGSLAWVRRLSFVAVLIVVAFAPGPAAARPRFTGCGPRHADRPRYATLALHQWPSAPR